MPTVQEIRDAAANKQNAATNQAREKLDYKNLYFKPTKTMHRIRVVPNPFDVNNPIVSFKEHNGKLTPVIPVVFGERVKYASFLSRSTYGEVDPIEQKISELYATNNKENREFMKNLYLQDVYFLFVVDRDNEAAGIKLWKLNPNRMTAILAVVNDSNTALSEADNDIIVHDNFYEIETGNDLIIDFVATPNKMKPGTTYLEISKITAKKGKRAFTDAQWEELKKTAVNPERTYFNTTKEKIGELLDAFIKYTGFVDNLGMNNSSQESSDLPYVEDDYVSIESDEMVPSPPVAARKPVPAKVGKPVIPASQQSSFDEAFGDDDDSLPF